jgi:hypothetical protein
MDRRRALPGDRLFLLRPHHHRSRLPAGPVADAGGHHRTDQVLGSGIAVLRGRLVFLVGRTRDEDFAEELGR